MLARVLARKAQRRMLRTVGCVTLPERAVMYNGVVVFDTPKLHGEGITVGADYLRALVTLGFTRCDRIFEFCAGPGYIGYSLLANGFCERLTLADINPVAVKMARRTAAYNGIESLVNIYQSDVLDGIPVEEQWNLVVSNPPHFLPRDASDTNIRAFDPDWRIHRRFYASIRKFMKPGGHVVMQENSHGSSEGIFKPMIESGGGTFVTSCPEKDVRGHSNGMYYMVSCW
jgi:methylase of polypeptide subunit release factors